MSERIAISKTLLNDPRWGWGGGGYMLYKADVYGNRYGLCSIWGTLKVIIGTLKQYARYSTGVRLCVIMHFATYDTVL